MYAIVITGGKQYRVSENDVIEVEKLKAEPGATVELDVAFIADGTKITTDQTALAEAKVFATVEEHFKGVKALVFKFQKRKGYKRMRGHRQELTRLRIAEISLSGKQSKKSSVKSDEKLNKAEEKAVTVKEKEPAKKAKTAAKATTAKKSVQPKDDTAKATVKATKAKPKAEKKAAKEPVVDNVTSEQVVEPERTAE